MTIPASSSHARSVDAAGRHASDDRVEAMPKRFSRAAWASVQVERPNATLYLYLRPAIEAALRVVGCDKREYRGAISRAERIDDICERYAALVADFTPRLSEAHWCGLMDILDPGLTSEQFKELRSRQQGLLRYVRTAHACGIPVRRGYDSEALERELADLPDTTFYAIVEIADRFWSSNLTDDRSPRQRLEDCGAHVL